MCRLKAKAGKIVESCSNFNKQKKVSVLNSFSKYYCIIIIIIIINCFTLVFYGFDLQTIFKKQAMN